MGGFLADLLRRRRQAKAAERQIVRFKTSVPSTIPEICFTAKITGKWRSRDEEMFRHARPEAEARVQLRRAVSLITKNWSILHVKAAQDAVNAQLGCRSPLLTKWLTVEISGPVKLSLRRRDIRIIRRYRRAQRDKGLQLEKTAAHLQFLHDRVFSQETTAKIWWLTEHPDKLTALQNSSAIKSITDEVTSNRRESRDDPQDAVVHLLAQFFADLDPKQKELMLHMIHRMIRPVFIEFGRKELLDSLEPQLPWSKNPPNTTDVDSQKE